MIPRIFIVDDEAPARARLRTILSDIAEACPHVLVGEAGHAQAALEGIVVTAPDVVLVDVQMPEINGLQMVEQLMQTYEKQTKLPANRAALMPIIIFVTAYENYAVNAFDVHAFDYLLKPVRAARLQQALARATRSRFPGVATAPVNVASHVQALSPLLPLPVWPALAAPTALTVARTHFSVLERGRVLLVPVDEVRFLKAELKYVVLGTRLKEYLIEDSLMSIEDELCLHFVRVHRNALVARSAIIGVERGVIAVDDDGVDKKMPPLLQQTWQVILRDVKQRLPISRRQWAIVRALVR
ncbi:LytTR family DNA-binding domain-containing protein [Glaciimonas sp. PAMC28666]|uniref:LytR/AlgR family response regulator transcription factor n=1 Tax=Glaciimonas sp. PAMC28666 TaxID=2807626 RepID=UPI001964C5FD|nr:LytTR family DNA-binding domain-containing protein [Glaciimonas sp. PAMC28666]QRX83379.1 response regulator transcription factor [Glaciimonas sp. PAMC28666]